MTIALTKRTSLSRPITAAEQSADAAAIETAVNAVSAPTFASIGALTGDWFGDGTPRALTAALAVLKAGTTTSTQAARTADVVTVTTDVITLTADRA